MENVNAEWDFFFTEIEEKPVSISLDLKLADFDKRDQLTYLIRIYIYLKDPTEEGLTTTEENEVMYEMEDEISEKISAHAIEAGRVKTGGKVIFFFYADTDQGMEDLIEEAITEDYEFAVDIEEDLTWDAYFNFLYPDPYDMKSIMNRRVLTQLEKQGDLLEKEREVDHWLYFKTPEGADNFLQVIAEHGFKTLSNEVKKEDPEYAVSLNISRNEFPHLSDINKITWYLMEKAEENNGFYDGWGCPVNK